MFLKEHYWYFDKALSKDVCEAIIEEGFKKPKTKGTVGDNKDDYVVIKKTRNSTVSWISEPWVYNILHPYLELANKNAGWNFEWDFSEACQFTIYGKNQHYDWHSDQRHTPYPDDYTNHRCRGKIRKLSMTVQLSKKEDYTGGELEFDYRNTKKNNDKKTCTEAKEQGTIIVFPSFVWHRVRPVKSGKRCSLVMWSLGKPFK
jgi:PKHD-type hydroxylase